jgi:hypothetical protein
VEIPHYHGLRDQEGVERWFHLSEVKVSMDSIEKIDRIKIELGGEGFRYPWFAGVHQNKYGPSVTFKREPDLDKLHDYEAELKTYVDFFQGATSGLREDGFPENPLSVTIYLLDGEAGYDGIEVSADYICWTYDQF